MTESWLAVKLHDDLASRGTLHNVVVLAIGQVNGVQSVTSLSAISRETLDEWLLPPEQSFRAIPGRKRHGRHAERA